MVSELFPVLEVCSGPNPAVLQLQLHTYSADKGSAVSNDGNVLGTII